MALLVVGELALRSPFVISILPKPEPTLWHAANVQAKIDYLHDLQARRGVDVLFIGNSTVLAGVNPQIFDQARGGYVDDGSIAFNGAMEGIPAYGALRFIEIYARYAHPKTIIYGITPQDLNENSPSTKAVTLRIKDSPRVIADTRDDLHGRLVRTLLEDSSLYLYRRVLYQFLMTGGNIPVPKIYFDERGFVPSNERLSEISPNQRTAYFNIDGVLNYSAQGEQTASLRELIVFCARRNIQLILLNMPLADDYLSNPTLRQVYPIYWTTLTQIAAELRVPLWDMVSPAPVGTFDDASFADFNHLNRFGAAKLSTLLGQQYAAFDTSRTKATAR